MTDPPEWLKEEREWLMLPMVEDTNGTKYTLQEHELNDDLISRAFVLTDFIEKYLDEKAHDSIQSIYGSISKTEWDDTLVT